MNVEIEKTNMSNTIGENTLAHEMVAKEEQNTGIFFAAFSIQFYLTKDMLKMHLKSPQFLKYFNDIELYASQRVFIKNIISNQLYKKICEDLQFVLNEYEENGKQPHDLYLSRINKSFLIRQIFKQTDQVLPKYNFIEKYIGQSIVNINMNDLYENMCYLPIEQQVLVLVRIFNQLKDNFENKKKTISESFIENISRIKQDYMDKEDTNHMEYKNIQMFGKQYGL